MGASEARAPAKAETIYVAGHGGMVGSALLHRLRVGGYSRFVTRSRAKLDLLDQRAVRDSLAAKHLLDCGRLQALGCLPRTGLRESIQNTDDEISASPSSSDAATLLSS